VSIRDTLDEFGVDTEYLVDEIVKGVVEALLDTRVFSEEIKQLIRDGVTQEITKMVAPIIADMDSRLGDMALQATNRWGELLGEPMTFREYAVSRAEAILAETFDGDAEAARINRAVKKTIVETCGDAFFELVESKRRGSPE